MPSGYACIGMKLPSYIWVNRNGNAVLYMDVRQTHGHIGFESRAIYSPGPEDFQLVGLPAGAARGGNQEHLVVLEHGWRLPTEP